MKIRPIDRIFSILSGILTPFFLVACAAIVPCAFRPFYYACIRPLQIPETSGYSVETIREAFDDVMDFLWCGAEFKTGSLAWTESEKAHFADCIPAFHLQAILLIAGGIFLIVYLILLRRGVLRRARLFGVPSVSYGAAGLLLFLAAVGGYAALDFGGLFHLFHKIVFPEKRIGISIRIPSRSSISCRRSSSSSAPSTSFRSPFCSPPSPSYSASSPAKRRAGKRRSEKTADFCIFSKNSFRKRLTFCPVYAMITISVRPSGLARCIIRTVRCNALHECSVL